MHIIECDFEFSGFDDHLVKAGTSVYLWNLCQQFRLAGHRVTGLTPAHGLLGRLREQHEITDLAWRYSASVPVPLDPRIWPGFDGRASIAVEVAAHRLEIDGVEIILLSGGGLDEYPSSFYPPAALEGRSLSFFKPLIFQLAAARFLAEEAAPGTVVHLHEPAYHYLIPAALAGRGLVTVSTVQTNMPVNTKVYGPEVRAVLSFLGADPSITDGLTDPPVPAGLREFLPAALLHEEHPTLPGHDYLSLLGLVARSADALDFLSTGQLDHALTQADSPFEELFRSFSARRELLARRDRLFVGGCAIGDDWLNLRRGAGWRSAGRRERTLTALGLDPALPSIYHNARYTVQHKGQQEMFRALLYLLDDGERFNALLHCLAPSPPHDPDIDALVRRYPGQVRIETRPMTQPELMDWATASDLCLFPSKFEMDTFLMAMGEAMAAGAVPVATAQQGMRHFGHAFDLGEPGATGLALPRSFRVDDPVLTEAICAGVRQMLHLMRTEPGRFEALREQAVEVARQFSWRQTAHRFLEIFAAAAGRAPAPARICETACDA
ncbi:MAG TPA: glycosyltransferase [Streptosporangiaceae bacterium]|nr:glycosyltransferase [Streptosporangiaceae bacterium]